MLYTTLMIQSVLSTSYRVFQQAGFYAHRRSRALVADEYPILCARTQDGGRHQLAVRSQPRPATRRGSIELPRTIEVALPSGLGALHHYLVLHFLSLCLAFPPPLCSSCLLGSRSPYPRVCATHGGGR